MTSIVRGDNFSINFGNGATRCHSQCHPKWTFHNILRLLTYVIYTMLSSKDFVESEIFSIPLERGFILSFKVQWVVTWYANEAQDNKWDTLLWWLLTSNGGQRWQEPCRARGSCHRPIICTLHVFWDIHIFLIPFVTLVEFLLVCTILST